MGRAKSKKIRDNQRLTRFVARRIIFEAAFYDDEKAELVNKLDAVQVLAEVAKQIPSELTVGDVPNMEKGEVITDSRGEGSFQKIEKS